MNSALAPRQHKQKNHQLPLKGGLKALLMHNAKQAHNYKEMYVAIAESLYVIRDGIIWQVMSMFLLQFALC